MQMLTNMFLFTPAEPHSSVGSTQDLRTGGRWFDSRLDQFSFQVFMMIIVSKVVMWKSSQWLKELQESMDWCTDRRDITEIPLKIGVKRHAIFA